MSKKKWRKAANPEYKPPVTDPQPVRPVPEPQPEQQAARVDVDAPPSQPVPQFDLNVTDDEAMGFINEMTRFLGGVVARANAVLQSVRFEDFRETVAGDLPHAGDVVARNIELAQKKLPKSHPLLAVIRYTMAASRLLTAILKATKPHLFGRPFSPYQSITRAAEAAKRFLGRAAPPEVQPQPQT